MKVPKNILRKVEKILARDAEEKKREREAKLAEKKRWQEVDKLRKSKREELLVYAKKVVNWLNDFYQSKEGQKVFRAQNYVTIFNASFWNGFPASGREMTTFATIEFSDSGRVTYSERYKGFPREALFLGFVGISPNVLVKKLHPEYLELFAKAIDNGKVWQHIEWSLR